MEKHWQNIALLRPQKAGRRQKAPSRSKRGNRYELTTNEVVTASGCVTDPRNAESRLGLRALQYRLNTLGLRDPNEIFARDPPPRCKRCGRGSVNHA